MTFTVDELLARLIVARDAGLPVPAEMVDPLIAQLARAAEDGQRRNFRDREIRLAALFVGAANDSAWTKAGALVDTLAQLARAGRIGNSPARLHLQRASTFGEVPGSRKQLERILKAANDDSATPDLQWAGGNPMDMRPVEMSNAAVARWRHGPKASPREVPT